MKSNKNLVVGGLSLLIVLLAVVIFSLGSDLFLRPVPGEEQVGSPIRTPVITISVNPASIQQGGSSTLSWYVQYATSCTATGGWSGVQPVQGKRAVNPSITTTYTLTCTNGHRTAQRGVTLNVNSPSYTITASAGTGGSIQPAGQIIIQPGTSQLFTITPQSGFQVSGLTVDGQSVAAAPSYTFSNVSANHSIIANFAPAQPSIEFGMDPDVPIDPGASVSLAWTAHNAVSCIASGGWSGSRALAGSITLSPWVTTTYTLTCSNSSGTQAVSSITAVVSGSTQCSDGVDNDGDSLIDMNDPGCSSLGDDNEFNSPISSDDGLSGAPAGAAQHPTLLANYPTHPSWHVAGVNYAVGYPSNAVLTDWWNLSGPGITVNTSGHYVSVYNTPGTSISNVDFSLHNGAYIYFVNSPNSSVRNSKFGGSSLQTISNAVIVSDSPNLTVEYNVIDGGGPGSGSSLVSANANGLTTVRYNWLKNFPQHALELGSVSTAVPHYSVVYKYNLIENGGRQVGAHYNDLQLYSVTATADSVDVEYNTVYQVVQEAGGEAFQFYDSLTTGTIDHVVLAFNTLIGNGWDYSHPDVDPYPRPAISYMIHGGDTQNHNNPVAHDNYFDLTGAYNAFYPNVFTGWTAINNYNMVTGALLNL